ncbi:MAG: MATE family efflux transporter [Oscillospiraceae bacterium]|nr:MATE family efflux transporter [Oscillospiraceae bacterium]
MAQKKTKIIRTALDGLPYGEENEALLQGKVGKPRLPDGVSQKSMMRDIVVIAWPSLLELVLTQLTSMADQIMVGRLPGEEGVMALAAVGLAAQPKFLLMTMIIALNVGATALVARFRGQQDRGRASEVLRQALVLNVIISAVFMGIGLWSSEWLIRFMSGSGAITEETLRLGVQYFDIQLYGFIPLCIGFTITAALRGIGESRVPLVYNTIANVVNLVFNYVMIYGKLGCPAMGVAGASWATVIGQTVAFVIAMGVVLSRRYYVWLDLKSRFRFDAGLIRSIVDIGVPSMVEQLFLRAGLIIYSRTVAGLGDMLFATHQVLMSVQAMTFMMGQAFANAATTLMGQSLGKRRYDMAALYMRGTRNLGILASLVLALLLVLFNRQIILLFNDTPDVVNAGAPILYLLAASQPFQADQFITSGGLRGAGDTRFTAIAIAITVLGVRSILGILTMNVLHWGLWGAWIALVADQMIRTVLMALRYHGGKWRRIGAAMGT